MTATMLAELFDLGHDPETAWMARSVCGETDPEVFFPEPGGSIADVKALCRSCPVQFECLAYAVERPELEGVWGGTGERERMRMRSGASLRPLAA